MNVWKVNIRLEVAELKEKKSGRRRVCGVLQGSVSGPVLRNLTYDAVLRTTMRPESVLTCYADDTFVLDWGSMWGRTIRLPETAVACVVAFIKGLGLEVSLEKSEAL